MEAKKLKPIYKITHAVSSHSVQLEETMGFKIMYSLRNHIKSLLSLIEVGLMGWEATTKTHLPALGTKLKKFLGPVAERCQNSICLK